VLYTPEANSTLTGPWSPLTTEPAIASIDSAWERATYTDAITPAPARFLRVRVTAP
jgi:hypothetical protein